jgi:hypothetical protein
MSVAAPHQTVATDPLTTSETASADRPLPTAQSAVPRGMRRYLALDDFEAAARRRLPKMLYGFISGAAETDAALRDNRQAFADFGFVPRVLMDVSNRNQTTTLFGKTYAAPFGIPPFGSAALCTADITSPLEPLQQVAAKARHTRTNCALPSGGAS